jgi:hypothetical protein
MVNEAQRLKIKIRGYFHQQHEIPDRKSTMPTFEIFNFRWQRGHGPYKLQSSRAKNCFFYSNHHKDYISDR